MGVDEDFWKIQWNDHGSRMYEHFTQQEYFLWAIENYHKLNDLLYSFQQTLFQIRLKPLT